MIQMALWYKFDNGVLSPDYTLKPCQLKHLPERLVHQSELETPKWGLVDPVTGKAYNQHPLTYHEAKPCNGTAEE